MINEFQLKIQKEIDQFISDLPHSPESLYAPVKYTMEMGGKRLRPLLVLMANDLFDGDPENALSPAAGIEVFHNFTLLHDDIMDNAPLRRNKKTVHEQWGKNIAILSGDAMFAQACKLMSKTNSINIKKILEVFHDTAIKVCEGQQEDMTFETSHNVTIEAYLNMISNKTAALLAGSLMIGSLCADISVDEANHLWTFGKNAGICFQLQDDLLDVYGNQEIFGKKQGGDIIANKKTFLLLKTLELSNPQQKEYLRKIFEKEKNNDVKLHKVIEVYDNLDIPAKTRNEISFYYDQALIELGKVNANEQKKELLKNFMSDLLVREA